ncbi:MAG: sugar ABC transporter ATP-binding protein [Allobranchiibius sp.]
MSVASDVVLRLDGVSKSFPGVRALRDVSLELHAGEVHALVGENGAGKSTLIKISTGVYTVDEGQVSLLGEPVSFNNPLEAQAAGVSTIYQEVNLIPLMSVARNLFLGREPRRFGLIDTAKMNRDARVRLHEFGIDVDPTRPLRSLALGTQQMVSIARAVEIDARVVIMDEPTSSLEKREVETLFGVIERLAASGIAILYVSHRMEELYRICKRVTVMRDGAVVGSSTMADISRLQLISMMLGRDASELKHGTTAFTENTAIADDVVLSAQGLTARHALDDVSVQIRRGEVVGLGGLLGAGRSETARAIVGALPTEGGEVMVNGVPLTRRSPAAAINAGIAMLSEDRKLDGIIPGLSVRENIVLAALPRLSRFGLVNRAKQDEVVKFFIDRLKIKVSSPEQKVSNLSGGNQQKVLLARWLCLQPKALLLDEPTRGIDVGAKAEVQRLIDELAQDGLAVLLISSDLEELIEGSHRIIVLKEGRIIDTLTGEGVTDANLMRTLAAETPDVPADASSVGTSALQKSADPKDHS